MKYAAEPDFNNATPDKLRYIFDVLLHIEEHLAAELNPEGIAGMYFISTSRLYRDFYACTGHSVKEYIRKRRISCACEKLKCSDMPLAIVAAESGCQTQQAFHKQFKSVVGMTPLDYRKSDAYFYFQPFTADKISLAVKVGRETIPECAVTRFYDSRQTGIEDKAIAALFGGAPGGAVKGRVFGRNGKQLGGRFCYEILTEQVGAGKSDLFATCVVNYNEPEISGGWNYLYNTWLSASMFEESGGYFEEYIFQNGKNPRKLKLYLPVKKKKTEQHISIADIPEMTFLAVRADGCDAERKASEKVITFLREHNPLLIQNARRFYVCLYGGVCECGIECGGGFIPPNGSGLEIIRVPAGRYAVLPDDRLGDIGVGAAKMELWLKSNAIPHENTPVFAVYETYEKADGKYDSENIHMKLYKRLKS